MQFVTILRWFKQIRNGSLASSSKSDGGEGITLRTLIGKLLAGGGLVCSSTECKVTQNSSGQDCLS